MWKIWRMPYYRSVWIAPHAVTHWTYNVGVNGVAFASADPKTPDSVLVAVDQAVRLERDGSVTHFVSIRNDGPAWGYAGLMMGGEG